MKWQSDNRSTEFFEQRNGIVKFYPLDVSQEERNLFIKASPTISSTNI